MGLNTRLSSRRYTPTDDASSAIRAISADRCVLSSSKLAVEDLRWIDAF